MKELIPHAHPIELATIEFKDDRLAKATQRITSIYNDAAKYAEKKNREIAKILGEVMTQKSYEADGFKSVADYASTVFNINKNNAYALANAGIIYNSNTANEELKAMSPSKLAEISSVNTEILNRALADGTITRNTTQSDLREFSKLAKDTAEADKPVALDIYEVHMCLNTGEKYEGTKTIEEWDREFIKQIYSKTSIDKVEVIKLPKRDGKIIRKLYVNSSYSLVVEFTKHKSTKKYTDQEITSMMINQSTGK